MPDKLDRIAIVVDDVDSVANEMEAVFGMTFTIFEVTNMGIKVGLGNDGIELVEKIADSDLERLWKRPLAAVVLRVDDVDECARKMAEIGVAIDHHVTTAGGMREISFGTNFRGLPLVVCDGDGDVVGGVGADNLTDGQAMTPIITPAS